MTAAPDPTEVKARRYLAEGRVHVIASSWRGITADVTGDHDVYHVSVDPKGWACSCPSMTRCSHAIAVALVWDDTTDTELEDGLAEYEEDDPERPFEAVEPAEGYEQARLSHDAGNEPFPEDAEGAGEDTTVDVETGEVLEVAVPSRADFDLAAAPVTWNTLRSIADTEMVNASLRGRPYAMYAALLYGRELGIGPMQSLQHIAVIDGSAVLSAELVLSRFRHAGHQLRVLRMDDQAVALKGTRGDNGDELEVVYQLEDAVTANLVEVGDDGRAHRRTERGRAMPWETYTSDMLWARAVTRLVRRLAPDVLGRSG